jgi:hypothetical protein
MDDHLHRGRTMTGRLWRLLMFELWHRNFAKFVRPAGLFSCRWSPIHGGTYQIRLQSWLLPRRVNDLVATRDAATVTSNQSALSPINLFLMTNNVRDGGSERQFAFLPKISVLNSFTSTSVAFGA